jgi:protein-S-isoprenylcysteine O-methyltransferase Ste14
MIDDWELTLISYTYAILVISWAAWLNADHKLIQAGPHHVVRHPIYASLLCMMLGSGFLVTPLPILLGALTVFIIGTEIRVRVEDRLLESRFGDRFRAYRERAPACAPFLR